MTPIRCVPIIVILFAAGCGGEHAEFNGQVTYRGKPVYRGSITIVGSDKIPHIAAIGDDGTFQFQTVPTGIVKIGVRCPEPTADDAAASTDLGKKLAEDAAAPTGASARRRWFKIPEKCGDPETSNLTAEIVKPSTTRRIVLDD